MSRSSEGQSHSVLGYWPNQQCLWVWSESVD